MLHPIALFCLGAVVALVGLPCVQAESCFDAVNTPSCSAEGIQVDEGVDAQAVCAILDMDYFWGFQFNLDLHASALSSIPAESELCNQIRQTYHLCYWCEPDIPSGDYCFFNTCEKPEEIDETVDLRGTCKELKAMSKVGEYPATIDLCYRAEQAKHLCPVFCGDPRPTYLKADTTKKKRTLVWIPRVSALLSFLGACYIIWDVLSVRDNRSTVYHQLLFGMACFDIVTAAAWSLSTVPIRQDEAFYIEGAAGNEQTCKTQAFFIQLGLTSIFYNVSLALYYLLVIVYNWKESALRDIRVFLHGFPLLVGFGLAFAAIPFYNWTEYVCHLEPPPGEDWWKTMVFALLPIGLSIAFITIAMIILYLSVRQKSRASRKWSLGIGGSGDMEKRVFWQALLYTLSFYITWPIVFCVYIYSLDVWAEKYWFALLFAAVAPLQGFNNFLVYVRPRAFKIESLTRASRRVSSLFASTVFRFGPNSNGQIDTSSSSLGASAMMARRDGAISQKENPIDDDDDDDDDDAIKEDPTDRTEEEDVITEAISEENPTYSSTNNSPAIATEEP